MDLIKRHAEYWERRYWPLASIGLPLLGLFLIGLGLFRMQVTAASNNWPTIPGHVIKAGIAKTPGRYGSTYAPKVIYQYTVDGRSFQNDQLKIKGIEYSSIQEAQEHLAQYGGPPPIEVYVNPDDPSQSFLEPIAASEYYYLIALGLLTGVVGFVLKQ